VPANRNNARIAIAIIFTFILTSERAT
jgi:hypothetical protein